MYDVIDGKQRLETILLFLRKGPLAKVEELQVKTSFDESPLDWWSWRDLNAATRNSFLTAKIATIEVEGDLGDIIDLFIRINATGKQLTPQEKRHARYYSSPILKAAQKIADEHLHYFARHRILSPAQLQRMKHVELIVELLLAVNAGMPLNKKAKVDEIIRGASLAAPELKEASADVRRTLKLAEVVLPDLTTTRFRQVTDFYTLALLLHRYRQDGLSVSGHNSKRNALAGALLRDFGRGVDEVNEQLRRGRGGRSEQEPFRAYLMTVKEGTDSYPQRKAREKLLREVLDGVFEERDVTRSFNGTQRRILWHASSKKNCSICGVPIKRWEDASVDHVEPYIKGGKTDLGNAGLAHKRCNSAAGARPKQ